MSDIVPVIIDYERQAREFLIKESHENLHDRVSRAYGILRTAQTISSEETMHLLSSVRMGVNLGLIRDLNIPAINELFIRTQPAHLQKLTGGEMDTDRPQHRAGPLPPPLSEQGKRQRRHGGAQLSKLKKKTISVPVIVLRTKTGYNAFGPTIDGCVATAKTVDAALK